MNDFVEQCRSEWKRLGVPDPVANEMATDLAADLQEAEAEGGSPEDVLGSAAFDPRAFAAAWALERGVVGRAGSSPARRRSRTPWAIAAFGVVAVVGAVLLLAPAPTRSVHLAVPAPAGPALPPRVDPVPLPAGPGLWVWPPRQRFVFPGPTQRVVAVDLNGGDTGMRTAGAVLLTVGLGGILAVALLAGRSRFAFRA